MNYVTARRVGHLEGGRRWWEAGNYTKDGDLDRQNLALQNHALMQSRGVPVSAIVEQLGEVLSICPACGGIRPNRKRKTCSRRCGNSLAGRANVGRTKSPMCAEHREKISAANKKWAAARWT